MATVNELINQVWEILDENSTFYPQAEIILNGINPAQRLLCLVRPDLLRQRTTIALVAGQIFVDLRQEAPRAWDVVRVTVGDVTGDSPTTSNGLLTTLTPTSLQSVARHRDWWQHVGPMRHYWRHGRHWVGIYKRPVAATTLTLIYRAMPTAFRRDQFDGVPDIAPAWHPAIAKAGAALLLLKEGHVEITKAMRLLGDVIGEEPLQPLQRALTQMQRTGVGSEA